MNNEYVMELMSKGYNCSQTVLLYFSDRLGTDKETAVRISQPFESGMFSGDTCGTLSGAYMVLGLAFGDGTKGTRSILKDKTQEFKRKFSEMNGSSICRDLLGIDISTDENLAIAYKEAIPRVCPKAVLTSVEILEDMLK